MLSSVIEEPLILPWDAVGKVTAYDYKRKSRYFLEFAKYVDPKLMHHKTGPGFAVEKERAEIRKGMENFIRNAISDPRGAKAMVLKFISAERQRIDRKEIGPDHLVCSLKPIKLALDLNEVALP